MPVLENHRRELFAQGVAKGLPHGRAYVQAGYAGKASEGAKRLMKQQEVRSRIREFKEMAAVETVFGMQEAMRFLIEVIETPVGAVNQTSRICQEWTRDELSTRTASSLARKMATASPPTTEAEAEPDERYASTHTKGTGRQRTQRKSRKTQVNDTESELVLEGMEQVATEEEAPALDVMPVLSRIKVKMPDKLKALELLARFAPHGWFGSEKRKVEISDLEAVVAAVSR